MDNYQDELVALTRELIRKESVTPNDNGAIDVLVSYLESLGFKNEIIIGNDPKADEVKNLYSELNYSNNTLAFAGHTDVVPAGQGWSSPPFAAEIVDKKIIGRGAVDMKSAICAFVVAVKEVIEVHKLNPSIALLITGNEEGEATNGTPKILEWFRSQNKNLSLCLVGEPTSEEYVGDTIKVGRRGSVNFKLKIYGKQGHVAYPHKASNPITALVKILNLLTDTEFDSGSEFFSATNLEITNIHIGNNTTNVIPGEAEARFNIRFNDNYTSSKLIEIISHIVSKTADKYDLLYDVSGESFINKNKEMTEVLLEAAQKVTGRNSILSTSGGTSDARFIKDICPTMELGLLNATAHHVDEFVSISDLLALKDIYKEFLLSYFR